MIGLSITFRFVRLLIRSSNSGLGFDTEKICPHIRNSISFVNKIYCYLTGFDLARSDACGDSSHLQWFLALQNDGIIRLSNMCRIYNQPPEMIF
jgi:hypothetical protein